ncbi:MAG: hypothetical protein KDA30_08555 [Phycisphaerales bacterium]|nr:hypothetical protein [Phycisphaerales bacterium]
MFRTILGATISILFAHSAAVLGAPEFVVTPLLPPPTAIGQRPAIQLDAAVILGDEVKGIFGGYLEGHAGEATVMQSSSTGGVVDARLGIEWRVCRRAIVGRVYSDFESVATEDGDYCELLAVAAIDSPSPGQGQPIAPRFVITEDAQVRVSWDASASLGGAMHQANVTFALIDPDALPPANVVAHVEHQGHRQDSVWMESDEIVVALAAGAYDIHASVSHQGTMAFPPAMGVLDTMSGHNSVAFRIEIIDAGCGADITGDGFVDVEDLNAVLAAWGTEDPNGDADCSGSVDVDDLNRVLSEWTQTCG